MLPALIYVQPQYLATRMSCHYALQDRCGGYCGGTNMRGQCPTGQSCLWSTNPSDDPGDDPNLRQGVCCAPNCDDRMCGDDGCGGSCGAYGGGCPSGQVCPACPVGSVTATTARRSLLGLPSWLGGKAPQSGDVVNYVVGVGSTLPRSAGGATAYLSATPCVPCSGGR